MVRVRWFIQVTRAASLCSIGNDHPFVPTCLLAERRRFESCCTHHQNQNLAGRRPEQKGRCPNLKVGRFSYCVRGLKELGAGPANPSTEAHVQRSGLVPRGTER